MKKNKLIWLLLLMFSVPVVLYGREKSCEGSLQEEKVCAVKEETSPSEGLLSKLKLCASGGFDFYSKYLWRGFSLDTDPVIQPKVCLGGYGLMFTFWSNWDVLDDDSYKSNEMDFIADYTVKIKNVNLSLGHTYYDFVQTHTFSKEFYIGMGLPEFLFSPSLFYYYDYGTHRQGGGHGQYLVLNFAKSFDIVKNLGITFDVGGHIAYNYHLYIKGNGGDFLATAGFTIPLTKNLKIMPNVDYAVPFSDLKDKNDGNQVSRFFGGFSLAYVF